MRALEKFPFARREEIARLKNEQARAQRTVGEALLRLAARERGVSAVTFLRGEKGKPCFAELPDLCFNLSHSGEVVVAAFSDRAVGIDVEQIVPRDFRAVSSRCFSEEEQKKIASSEAPLQEFYRIWTGRESIVKRRGGGAGEVGSVDPKEEDVRSFELSEGKLFPVGESGAPQYLLSVCASQGEKRDTVVHFHTAEEILSAFCG